jgi:iron complex outermembrane receptor protein
MDNYSASFLAIAVATASFASPAFAQATPETPPAPTASSDAPDIVVIGTRRLDRTVTDSASPVDIISATELTGQSSANMLDAVKNVVPSFFVPQNTISDASSFVRSPSLRGLPGDEVLVMLNGKRFNRSALVQVYSGGDTGLSYGAQPSDLSSIPSLAVGNLQVLRDGATAQYGSDAIAGVLNYGLRKDKGLELLGQFGQYYQNGDGDSYMIAGNLGFALGSRGFVNLTAEYDDNKGTSRGTTRAVAVVFAQNNATLAPQLPNYPGPVQIWGSSPNYGYKLMLNAGYDLTDNFSFYVLANYARSHADQSFNYRSPITATGLVIDNGSGTPATGSPGANGAFNNIYLTPCPTGNATCPAGGFVRDTNIFNFRTVYPAGFTPRFVGVVKQAWGTTGFKGKTAGGFTYDLSGTLAENSLALSMYQSLNSSYGPQSQTSFQFGTIYQRELNLNADFTYPVELGLASPVTLSAGGEFRRETFKLTAGDVQSYGAGPYAQQPLYDLVSPGVYTRALNGLTPVTAAQSPAASGYGGTSPASAGTWSQRSYGVYGGAEVDVTDAFSVGIAGRYEHYSNFGDATVGKINGIYRIVKGFSVRGTFGTGFHAPSPGQSHDSILTTNFITGNQVQTGTYPVDNSVAIYYGAKPLTPEKSTNWGAGFVVDPGAGVTLTVDYYNIKVKNRIFISQPFSVTAADIIAQPTLAAVGAGGNVSYFTNGLDTLTRGVDVVATYRTDLAGGKLNLTLAYNYNKSTVSKALTNVISAAQIIGISRLAPNHRGTFSANWAIGDFTLNGRVNYYGSWEDPTDYGTKVVNGQTVSLLTFGAKATADLDVSYTVAKRFTLTIGASNIFNTFPDKIGATTVTPIYALTNSTADGQIYPRSGGPFGMNGGFYYARLRIKY